MGLKARKIKSMIEEYTDGCIANLNEKVGHNFQFNINWDCIPANIDEWNWEDDILQSGFYTNFFAPMEVAFSEMFQDDMYKEAISEQVKCIVIEPGPEAFMEWSFADGNLICKHTLFPNYKEPERTGSRYIPEAAGVIKKAVDSGLS